MHAATRRHTLAAAIALAIALAGSACSNKTESSAAPAADMVASEMTKGAADTAAAAPERQQAAGGGTEEVKGLANHNGSQLAYTPDVRVPMPLPLSLAGNNR